MSEWKEVKLADLLDIKHGFAFPGSGITEEKTNHILVTPGNFNIGGGFKSMKFKYFKGNYPEEYVLKADDLVVTMTDLSQETDTLGYSAKIPHNNDVNYLHNQRIGLIKLISNEVNKDFIYWLMRTKEYQSFIVSSASGTAIMHTSPSRIKEYSCLIPPLSEQENIAEILSSLEEKINLLGRNNKTLEQLAETLFRQWFVENVKEDWEEIKLGQFIVPKKGKNITKSEAIDGKYPVVAGGLDPSCYHNQSNTKAPVITISASGANAGFVKLYYNEVWSSDSSFIDETVTDWVYFFYVLLKLKQNQIFDKQEGSAQPHIYPSHIMDLEIQKYPKGLIEKFNQTVIPIFNKISGNITQIEQLETLRNTLLPKLMSGAVIVK